MESIHLLIRVRCIPRRFDLNSSAVCGAKEAVPGTPMRGLIDTTREEPHVHQWTNRRYCRKHRVSKMHAIEIKALEQGVMFAPLIPVLRASRHDGTRCSGHSWRIRRPSHLRVNASPRVTPLPIEVYRVNRSISSLFQAAR